MTPTRFGALFLAALFTILPICAQVPTAQPQPTTSTYGLEALNLLPTYNRETFEAKFGKQAASFDASKPAKAWFDSTQSCPGAAATYKRVEGLAVVAYTMPACDALNVNIPGFRHYPPYPEPAESAVYTLSERYGIKYKLNPAVLSMKADAEALLNSMPSNHGLVLLEEILNDGDACMAGNTCQARRILGGFHYSYEATEQRRVYVLARVDEYNRWLASANDKPFSLYTQNVAQLIASVNRKGVGHPGSWVIKQAGGYWEFDIPEDGPSGLGQLGLPVPVRDLLPNEQIIGNLAGDPFIMKKAAAAEPPPVVAPSTGGGFSSADHDALQEILALLRGLFKQ